MCLEDNAEVCTMRPGRNCFPAIIDMNYEPLSTEEREQLDSLNLLSKDLKDITREIESMASNFNGVVDKINNSRRIR
jgi:hypothetical protein